MNSSSVQFFPLRVQLYGLQSSAAGALPPPPVPPPMARLQRISRNLFGAPAVGEVTHLLQEEKQRTCTYMLQRYSFDLQADIVADKIKESSSSSSPSAMSLKKETAALPPLDLISQELREHELRLQLGTTGTCNSSSRRRCEQPQQQTAETTPPHDTTTNAAKRAQLLQIRRIVATASAQCSNKTASDENNDAAASNVNVTANESSIPMGSNGSERLKPYARQTLLPNFFSLRKTKQFNGRNALLTVTSAPQHRQLEVLQLPKPMRAAATTSFSSSASASSTTESTLTTTYPATSVASEEEEQEVVESTHDNNETLSLLVSTESSPLASAASSTSIHPQAAAATLSSSATSS